MCHQGLQSMCFLHNLLIPYWWGLLMYSLNLFYLLINVCVRLYILALTDISLLFLSCFLIQWASNDCPPLTIVHSFTSCIGMYMIFLILPFFLTVTPAQTPTPHAMNLMDQCILDDMPSWKLGLCTETTYCHLTSKYRWLPLDRKYRMRWREYVCVWKGERAASNTSPFIHIISCYAHDLHNAATLADDHPSLNSDCTHHVPDCINVFSTMCQAEDSESVLKWD